LHHKNGFGVATRCGLINYYTCNDPHLRFDHKNFLWCPYHKDTPRQFECTRLITVDDVKAALQRLPGFRRAGGARPLVNQRKAHKNQARKR